jgi:hypothetical protein
MEGDTFLETSINFQRTTRLFIPEDSKKNLSRYFGGFTHLETIECELNDFWYAICLYDIRYSRVYMSHFGARRI